MISGIANYVYAVQPAIIPPDSYWDNVVGLWHFDGTGTAAYDSKFNRVLNGYNGATQQTDVSLYGNSAAGLFTGASNSDNSGRYFESSITTSDWMIGTGHYTMEAAIYLDQMKTAMTNRNMAIIGNAQNGNQSWYLFITEDYQQLALFYNKNGSYAAVSAPFSFQLGTWYRVALVIERLPDATSVAFKFFVNGIKIGETVQPNTSFSGSNRTITVGHIPVYGYYYYFRGYIDEIRLTKGVARYSSDYVLVNGPFPDS